MSKEETILLITATTLAVSVLTLAIAYHYYQEFEPQINTLETGLDKITGIIGKL